MIYRRFGNTGLDVSRMCLGTSTFGKQTNEGEANRILAAAAEAGINFIDTADAYPMDIDLSLAGRAEEITGRWLKGKRHHFIVATKGGAPMGPLEGDRGLSRKHLLTAIDESLVRLGTDYVDLYQLHFDDRNARLDETLEALDWIVRSGKARYVGTSNALAYRLARALGRSDVLGLVRFVSVQSRYSLLFREIERELLPLAEEESLVVLGFSPLAGGLLTGKYNKDQEPKEGRFSDEFGAYSAAFKQRYWHGHAFETVDTLRKLANQNGQSLATLSIAWILANPAITSVILGATRVSQLTEMLTAIDVQVSAELRGQLNEITLEYRRGDAGI